MLDEKRNSYIIIFIFVKEKFSQAFLHDIFLITFYQFIHSYIKTIECRVFQKYWDNLQGTVGDITRIQVGIDDFIPTRVLMQCSDMNF